MKNLYITDAPKHLSYLFLLFFTLTITSKNTYAQQTYATSQTNAVNGICILCGVVNPNNAVNNTNLNDYSNYTITAGLLGVSVDQTLIFPAANTNTGCDSLIIGIGSNNSVLTANLFSGIVVETFNGGVSNNDAVSTLGLTVRLLNGNTRAEIALRPAAKFDRVKISLVSTLVGALDGFRNYYAYYTKQTTTKPVVSITNFTICQGATATLTASTTEAGNIIDWYDASAGGNLLFTGNSYAVTPASTTTYYASTRTAACGTITRVPVIVNVNPTPQTPVVSVPATVCPLSSAQLTITNPQAGVTYNWYAALTDLTALGNGSTYNTLPLAANTTFYLDAQVTATGCKLAGGKQAVNVAVKNIALPTVTTTNVSVCSGDSVNLSAATDPGTNAQWYNVLTGGTSLFTGNNFKILPTANATYYVTAGAGTCIATGTRIGVNVNVNPRPIVPTVTLTDTICEGASAIINIPNPQIGATYNLFNTATGGTSIGTASGNTITTGPISNNTTLYLDANLPTGNCNLGARVAINIIVKKVPAPAVTSATLLICNGQTVNLGSIVNGNTSGTELYSALTGGTLLGTGANLNVSPSTNSTYYLSSKAGLCSSLTRTAVNVVVNPLAALPTINIPASVCAGQNTTISVASPQTGVTYSLFNTATGGTASGTGTSFTTGVLTGDQTLYVDAKVDATGCGISTGVRVPVNIHVNPAPVIPNVTLNDTICEGSSAIINIPNPQIGATYNLFNSATGGTSIGSGNTITTGPITDSTTLYLDANLLSGCNLGGRIAINIVVKKVPAPTVTSTTLPICSGQTVNVGSIVNGATSGTELYSALTGGTLLGSGLNLNVNPTANTTYYLSSKAGLCSSLTRTAVNVVVNPLAALPTISTPDICSGQNATLSVATPETGVTYSFFNTATGGTALGTGTSFTTGALTGDQTLYADAKVNASGCGISTGVRVPVNIHVNALPVIPNVSLSDTICEGGTATINIKNGQVGANYSLFNALTGGTSLGSGNSIVTGPITDNTTVYLDANLPSVNCNLLNRIAINIVVNKVTAPTITSGNVTICSGSSTNLTATAPGIIEWYSAATGGTLLGTGSPFTVSPAITTTYYAGTKSASCKSVLRTSVILTVNPVATVPTITGPADGATCEGQKATVSVTAPQTGVTYSWFSTATGGTALANGNSYTTAALSNDLTLYLDANASVANCGLPNGTRVPVTIVIKKVAAPTITSANVSICSGASANLSASTTETGGTIEWYSAANGGTLLGTGANFTVSPAITTTYYAGTKAGTCSSVVRTATTVTVNPTATIQTIIAHINGLICEGQTAALSVASPQNGVTYSWYDVATGGAALGNGNNFTTAALTNDQIFYLDANVTAGNCGFLNGTRVPIAITIKKVAVPVVTTTNVSICNGTSTNLLATTTESGGTIEWYSSASGGTLVGTGSPFTVNPANTTTYYASTKVSTCNSLTRAAATVTVNPVAVTPTISIPASGATCEGQSAALSVVNPQIGVTYNWYDAATGGTVLGTGNSFTTAGLTDNTTFYLDANLSAGNCGFLNGTRIPANVVIKKVATPVLTSSNVSICAGLTANLSATTTEPGGIIEWYSSASGGTAITTGTSYTVNPASTTTYYAGTKGTTCSSINRAGVTVHVDDAAISKTVDTPANGTTCEGQTATLVVNSPQANVEYSWFDAATGGTELATGNSFTTSALANDQTYYLDANVAAGTCGFPNGLRIPIKIVIKKVAAPTITSLPANICSGKTVKIAALSSVNGGTIEWYSDANAGTLLETDSLSVSPATTTTYYAATKSGTCSSVARTALTVTVNTSAIAPTINVPADSTTCEGQTATLSIANPEAGVVYTWFDHATGGIVLATGNSFTTNSLTDNTNFYLDANATSGGCGFLNGTRIPASVVIRKVAFPIITSSSITICSGVNADLIAATTESNATIEWYSAVTGGRLLGTGSPFTVNPIASTTYYAGVKKASCASVSRTALTVTVNQTATAPGINVPTDSICEGQTATLTLVSPQTDVNYIWYDTISGGTPLTTGISFTTPAIKADKTFYLDAKVNTGQCGFADGKRISATVNIKKVAIPTLSASSTSICSGTSTSLIANTAAIEWYSAANGGALLGTGSPFSVNPSVTTTYYASVKAGTCKSFTRTPQTIIVNDSATAQTVNGLADSICAGQNAVLTLASPQTDVTYTWYDAATGGTVLATGTSFTANVLTENKTFYLAAVVNATGCTFSNGKRAVVNVNIKKVALPATASQTSICYGSNTSLIATTTSGTLKWYADTTLAVLSVGTTFKVNPILTTTYFVQAVSGNCVSKFVPARVVILTNCQPYVVNDSVSTLYKTAISVSVTSNDYAGNSSLVLSSLDLNPAQDQIQQMISLANQGDFTGDAFGNITFRPADGFTGMAKIQYTIQNDLGQQLTPGWFIITVGPNAIPDKGICNRNTSVNLGNITSNDIDEDGIDQSSLDLDLDLPGVQSSKTIIEGVFTIENDMTVNFTPATGYVGTAVINYEVKDKKGIKSRPTEVTVNVVLPNATGMFIPQGFSPNGDGINDYFVIQGIEDYDVTLTIYNRWGNVVYSDKHYKNNWDASLNSGQASGLLANTKIDAWGTEKAPEGTYFYFLQFNNGEMKTENGFMVISR